MTKWAVRWAAARGDADAMSELGFRLLLSGRRKKAESWLRRAAEAGNTRGMTQLAALLAESGRDAEAQRWFLRYAGNG